MENNSAQIEKKPSALKLMLYKVAQFFGVPANTILVVVGLALLYFTVYPKNLRLDAKHPICKAGGQAGS